MGACKPSSQSDSPLATEAVADAARCVVHVGRATAKACMKFRMHMLSEFFFSRLLNAIYPLILTLFGNAVLMPIASRPIQPHPHAVPVTGLVDLLQRRGMCLKLFSAGLDDPQRWTLGR
jgi:hypothetical protein